MMKSDLPGENMEISNSLKLSIPLGIYLFNKGVWCPYYTRHSNYFLLFWSSQSNREKDIKLKHIINYLLKTMMCAVLLMDQEF